MGPPPEGLEASYLRCINVPDMDVLTLEYAGLCECGTAFSPGETVGFDHRQNRILCPSCLDATDGPPPPLTERIGSPTFAAGSATPHLAVVELADTPSTGAEPAAPQPRHAASPEASPTAATSDPSPDYHHRHAGEDEPARRHAPLRRAERLAEPSQREAVRAEKKAAEVEAVVQETIAKAVETGSVVALHDRHVPGHRAQIEHLAVGAGGVYVVEAQRYAGAPIAVRQAGGLFGPRRNDLYVRGQQRNDLVRGIERQAGMVRELLEGFGLGEVPVVPVLCFVEGSFPMFQPELPVGDAVVVGRKALRRLVARPGRLDDEQRRRIYVSLAAGLPA